MSDIKQRIINELNTGGVPNYTLLAGEEALQAAETILVDLLQEAKDRFNAIIEQNIETATFTSVVEPYLQQDRKLGIFFGFIASINNTNATRTTRDIIQRFQPDLVRYSNHVSLNVDLYSLLKAVEKKGGLNELQQRSLELLIRDMEIAGVHLKGEQRARLEEINVELGDLNERFSNNVLDCRKEFFQHFESDETLQEVPEEDMEAAVEEAEKRNLDGWVFTLSPPSYGAILQYCSDAEMRKLFWRRNMRVGAAGEFENREIILKTLTLRHEKAHLLGFSNYADYVLQTRMAESTEQVTSVLNEFAASAKHQAEIDLKELQEFAADKEKLEYWDIAYYSEKLREKKFEIDERALKKYFPLKQVLPGMLELAKELFGIELKEVNTPLYDESVMAFEAHVDGKHTAYFLLDLYARSEKRGGAWCDKLRDNYTVQHSNETQLPIVINVSNFAKPSKTRPVLLTHENLITLFHEFGHALHLLLGNRQYHNLSGFNTEWDFVELPSQLFENWVWHRESLARFAKHFETGEVISEKMLNSLKESRVFQKGLFMLRQNEFGFLDFLLHSEAPPKTVEALDAKCLEIANRFSIMPKPDDYSMYTSFGHIFGGGYAAGYYSYLWAEILEADVFSQFLQEGILNPARASPVQSFFKTLWVANQTRKR